MDKVLPGTDDNNIQEWINLSEKRKDWFVGALFGIWVAVNSGGIIIIIDFFIYQQEFIPRTKNAMSVLMPYIFILFPGIYLVVLILKRSVPVYIEVFFIPLMIILSFYFSGQKTEYIEHFIRYPELSDLCYRAVALAFNSSQFLIIPMWVIVRFMKRTPHNIKPLNFTIGLFALIIIIALSGLAYELLRALNMFPKIYGY